MALDSVYIARKGQSFFDICLQVYVDLNQLYKLAVDNNVDNIFQYEYPGEKFIFDKSLIKDTDITAENVINNHFYVTGNPFLLSGLMITQEDILMITQDGNFMLTQNSNE